MLRHEVVLGKLLMQSLQKILQGPGCCETMKFGYFTIPFKRELQESRKWLN